MTTRRWCVWLGLAACLSLAILGNGAGALAGSAWLMERPDLGLTVVHFEGQIVKGDLRRLQGLVPKATSGNPENQVFVSFASPGGLVWEGIAIGNYLRDQGIGTILLPEAICASACSFAFWGGYDAQGRGPRRIAMTGARLGVHRMYIPQERAPKGTMIDANVALEILQKRVAFIFEYLNDMEVSPEVQRRNFATSSKDIHFLTDAELDDNKVVRIERVGTQWRTSEAQTQATAILLPPTIPRQHARSKPPPASPNTSQATPLPQPNTGTHGVAARSDHRLRAIFYEEDPSRPQVPKATAGQVVWRVEELEAGRGTAAVTGVRAMVEIPEAGVSLLLIIRPNLDAGLPASHTVELNFTTRPGDPGRAVRDVGLLQFKDEEAARGTPLAGLPVPVRDNVFLIGLSNVRTERDRNIELMGRQWIDLPIRTAAGQRAILSIRKPVAGGFSGTLAAPRLPPPRPESTAPVQAHVTNLSRTEVRSTDPAVQEVDVVLVGFASLVEVLAGRGANQDQIESALAALGDQTHIPPSERLRARLLIAPGPRPGDRRQVVRVKLFRPMGGSPFAIAAADDRGRFVRVTQSMDHESDSITRDFRGDGLDREEPVAPAGASVLPILPPPSDIRPAPQIGVRPGG